MSLIKLAGLKDIWNKVTKSKASQKLIAENEELAKQLAHQKVVNEKTKSYARHIGQKNLRRLTTYGPLGTGLIAASAYSYGKNKKD